MHIIYGDMFEPKTYLDYSRKSLWLVPDAFVITTNGFVKNNGEAVMGRGCAKQAATKWPLLPALLGAKIKKLGNVVCVVDHKTYPKLVSFPVKPVDSICNHDKSNVVGHMKNRCNSGKYVPGWACKATTDLIEASAQQLKILTDTSGWSTVVLPQPGCGNGELNWGDVSPILQKYLDDRFYVITWK